MKKNFLSKKNTRNLLSYTLPLVVVSATPIVLSTSCSTGNEKKQEILDNKYFSKDIVDLSKDPYNTWIELKDVTTSYNDVWVRDFGIKPGDEFNYSNMTTPTTKHDTMSNLLFNSIKWDEISTAFPSEDIQKIKENTIFTVNNVVNNINGGVVIDYYVSIYYHDGKKVSPSYDNGLRKNGVLYLQGFKIYESTDGLFNSFDIEINTNLSYDSLVSGLPEDFFTNQKYTLDNKINMIYNFIRENWTKVFRIIGLVSAWDTSNSKDIFKNSLYRLIGSSNINNESDSLQIVGIPKINEKEIIFQIHYLKSNGGQVGNSVVSTSSDITISFVPLDNNSMITLIIVGSILIGGGAILLLIWLLALMPREQKELKGVDKK